MKTIERIPIVQQVVDSIREYILSGAVEVGAKLPTEKQLCENLSVGRGTVREAFRVLQANGLVEIRPGRGAFVARTRDPEPGELVEWFVQNEVELKDCIEVRGAIEPLSIRLAIERGSDADIARLGKIHSKFIKAVNDSDIILIAKYDELFHSEIVETSKNFMLVSISKKVNECIKNFRSKTFLLPQNVSNAVEPHSNIMRALEERDSEAGELFVRRHIQKILEDMSVIINH